MKHPAISCITASLICAGLTSSQTQWTKYSGNPVLDAGSTAGSWDYFGAGAPRIVRLGDTLKMWYSGRTTLTGGGVYSIGYAWSTDGGISWTKYANNPVFTAQLAWEGGLIFLADVVYDGSEYKMWYTGAQHQYHHIGYATSPDGIAWTRRANPVLDPGPSGWDNQTVSWPSVLGPDNQGGYKMWYQGYPASVLMQIGYATASNETTWTKYGSSPVLQLGNSGTWEDRHLEGPTVIYNSNKQLYEMWYNGERTNLFTDSRIGYATSPDGIVWTKYSSNPVLQTGPGDNISVFTGDVLFEGGIYKMWYSGYDGSKFRIGYATAPVDPTRSQAQAVAPNIRIHPNSTMQQFETSITTHPTDPNMVLVSAVTQDPLSQNANAGTMGWYYTIDGGATWAGRDTLPTHTNLNEWMGDPTVGIDLSGRLFIGGIYNDSYIFVDRSTNSGATWTHTQAYFIPSGYHAPNLAIDTDPSSSFKGQLYIASRGINFSLSTDSGQSFSNPVSISGTIGTFMKPMPRIAISPDSELYATWPGYDASSGTPVRLGFNRSTNRGTTWGTASSILSYNGVYGQGVIKGTQIYSGPSIAVDRGSSSRRGWVYIVYAEKNPTTPDIFLIRSTDKGVSWSTPVKVNQDNSGKDQWMPAIAVDPSTGFVFVVYYDSQNFPANDSAQVYISTSRNGGETFEHRLVSDTPFKPAPIRAPWDNDYMGQYIGIAALNHVVWPCWMDNRTGSHQVYTAHIYDSLLVTSVPKFIAGRNPTTFLLSQNFPNPFNPTTEIQFSLPQRSHMTLTIFDLLGREVTTLVSEELSAGSYSTHWDARGMASGVYLYRMRAGDFVETKKLLLLR